MRPHLTIRAFPLAACLSKIAHLCGISIQNPNLPLLAVETWAPARRVSFFLSSLIDAYCRLSLHSPNRLASRLLPLRKLFVFVDIHGSSTGFLLWPASSDAGSWSGIDRGTSPLKRRATIPAASENLGVAVHVNRAKLFSDALSRKRRLPGRTNRPSNHAHAA